MNLLRRLFLSLALLALLVQLSTPLQAQPPTPPPAPAPAAALPALVILVRHAEKATEPAGDPALTSEGTERAQALKRAVADSGVTHVITTQWRRTRETAAPLAAALGIAPEVVATVKDQPVEQHAEAVAAAVQRQPGGVVLVVGHSNTIPAILAALGGPHLPDLPDSAYGDLFVLTPGPGKARLVRTLYGTVEASPTPAEPK